MAGNHLLLPYKIIDALSSGNLTEMESWRFIKAMIDYDRSGVIPDFPRGEASALWLIIKPEIDLNKAKWAAEVKRRSDAGRNGGKKQSEAKARAARENGKSGGAPQGNHNAVKKVGNQPKQIVGLIEKTTQADNENENDNDSGSGSSTETTTTIFINACKKAGFTVNSKIAASITMTEILPADWFDGSPNFLEFVAEYIKNSYPNNSYVEQKKLFISALNWDDLHEEFPDWRKKKESEAATQEEHRIKEAAAQERRQKLDELRNTGPQKCGNCGKTILAPENNRGTCPLCGFDFFLNEDKGEWEFNEPISLSAEYKRLCKITSPYDGEKHYKINGVNN